MKHKISSIVIFTLLITAFSMPLFAQTKKDNKLPAFQDFISDVQPDGFVHAYEKGALNKFIIEYIPEGESLNSWTRMLSVVAVGPSKLLPSIGEFTALVFKGMRRSCQTLDIKDLLVNEGDARFRVGCDPVVAGKSILGGQGLRWEIGVYRFVRTAEALYQIHYVEHGVDSLSESRREQIYSDAETAVDKVLVCRLNGPKPCASLDTYTLGAVSQPVTGEPPCRSNDAVPCNPAVIFSVPASAAMRTDKSAKKALLVLDFSKEDLSSLEVLERYIGLIIKSLEEGHPEATLIVRGNSPDYLVTPEDRVRVGTFLAALRRVLASKRIIDPTAMRVSFMNFR